MIGADQPSVFPSKVTVSVSARSDGTMLDRTGETSSAGILKNRMQFCQANDIDYEDVVFQKIMYDENQTYDRLETVTGNQTVRFIPELSADGLFTREKHVGLFLPVADCLATVVYDPVKESLALLHLGRHSTMTELISQTVKTFESSGSSPGDLIVWMSPGAHRQTYQLEHFSGADDPMWHTLCVQKADGFYIDMPGFNRARFEDAGVLRRNVRISPINTMTSDEYFSHATGDAGGRMAVLAMMR